MTISPMTISDNRMKIIQDNPDFLVIEKPAGLISHPAQTTKETTLKDTLEREYPTLKKVERGGLVHRLDRDTSGILVVAKNNESLRNLQSQFKERRVKKKYQALVFGKLEPQKGSIRLPIGRSFKNRKKMDIRIEGREATTDYLVLKYLNDFSLVEASPLTGRTHQIRIHFQKIGHSIFGDQTYASKKEKSLSERLGLKRQFLHSSYLGFFHPKTNQWVEFRSQLPQDLKAVLKRIK